MKKVSVQILREQAKLPVYATAGSAGADLCACLDAPITIAPGETKLIPIGIAVAVPEGYAALVFARSGLATKRHLAPANKVGVIDSDALRLGGVSSVRGASGIFSVDAIGVHVSPDSGFTVGAFSQGSSHLGSVASSSCFRNF